MEEIFDVVKVGTDREQGLREICESYTNKEIKSGLGDILDKMYNTMINTNGVGIAAPQVGIQKRMFVIGYQGMRIEFINPEIIEKIGEVEGREGCLSVPGKAGIVVRPKEIFIKFKNREGEKMELRAHGFLARIICHENDHLNGILYTDIAKEIFDK